MDYSLPLIDDEAAGLVALVIFSAATLEIPNSQHSGAIFSPSGSRAMNLRRSFAVRRVLGGIESAVLAFRVLLRVLPRHLHVDHALQLFVAESHERLAVHEELWRLADAERAAV